MVNDTIRSSFLYLKDSFGNNKCHILTTNKIINSCSECKLSWRNVGPAIHGNINQTNAIASTRLNIHDHWVPQTISEHIQLRHWVP